MLSFVDVKAQNDEVRNEIGAAIGAVVNSGAFILGPQVEQFEKEFAEYIGVGHAVGVGCGLDALSLSLRAMGVGEGDKVLVPTNSFVASAQAVTQVGAFPVFVDCVPGTYLMDLEDAEHACNDVSYVKAIMPVHLYGQCLQMEDVMALASLHDLLVIEDACQAHGAERAGQKAGSVGWAGCFSFYPAKNLGCFGDGGIMVTDDKGLADEVREYRNYGQRGKYNHVQAGVNSRLDTIQAAVLSCKLKKLDSWNARRRIWATAYNNMFAGIDGIVPPVTVPGNTHVYHLYVLRIEGLKDRAGLIAGAKNEGVPLGIHYPMPIHQQPYYRDTLRLCPVAAEVAGEIISLPMHPHLTKDDVEKVVEVVTNLVPKVR